MYIHDLLVHVRPLPDYEEPKREIWNIIFKRCHILNCSHYSTLLVGSTLSFFDLGMGQNLLKFPKSGESSGASRRKARRAQASKRAALRPTWLPWLDFNKHVDLMGFHLTKPARTRDLSQSCASMLYDWFCTPNTGAFGWIDGWLDG